MLNTNHKAAVRTILLASGAVLLASPGASQQGGAPIARYTMDASTTSGMAAMGGGMGGGFSMMFGGGGDKTIHTLELRLGSSRQPTGGGPKADHFMPPVAKLGKSVPLITPEPGKSTPADYDFQKPKGRLLIFWGCGQHAGKGQPVIIDFAKVAAGQMPPNLFGGGVAIPKEWEILRTNSTTYGTWPNGKDRKVLSSSSSLVGPHKVAGNYSPDMNFALQQDFMGPITGRATKTGSVVQLAWNSVAQATGYYAWTMGFNPDDKGEVRDMVWWSSSSSRNFGGALWDWLSPATVQRLIGQKVVMPPSQTTCLVPEEVKKAAPGMMIGNLYAYGPEVNITYPPRPADARIPWKPEWTMRARFRSNTMWFIDGPAGMGAGGEDSGQGQGDGQPQKRKKPGFGDLLGGGLPF